MKNDKLKRKDYESELRKLQVELVRLQAWIKNTGQRIIVVFEGRDAAGKGGMIKRITERVSPRVFRVVALPAPTEREKTQLYIQRYITHFPAAGEIIIFDRSWYNRFGVERVMGFCTEKEVTDFFRVCPNLEQEMVKSGIRLVKYFFDVSREEQERRFLARIKDPLKHWKLNPMDLESYHRWWDYTRAYNEMFENTNTEHAPWYIVPADDKRRARLNCIRHLLSMIPYETEEFIEPSLPERQEQPGDLQEEQENRNIIPEYF
jgi:polyphosphate kinase 2